MYWNRRDPRSGHSETGPVPFYKGLGYRWSSENFA